MKQVGRFGLWVPEDTDAPDAPSQIDDLVAGTGSNDGLNDHLARAGANARKKVIEAEQSTESLAYTTLGTVDEVTPLILDEDGLIFLTFRALWKSSKPAEAAFFLNGEQLLIANGSATNPGTQAAIIEATSTSFWSRLFSAPYGLVSQDLAAISLPGSGTSTKPRVLGALGLAKKDLSIVSASSITLIDGAVENKRAPYGGLCVIEAAAGEYTAQVRYKLREAGKLEVRHRALRGWTKTFI